MVRLAKLPEQAIIDGFKGKVDFYLCKGIPCARKWPVWKTREPTPEERKAQEAFAYVNHMAANLPPYVIEQYRRMAAGLSYSWKDFLVRGYLSGTPRK